MTKDIGELQCVKQTSFVRVTCQMPAVMRVTADANTNGPVIAPMRPDAINAKSAATPNAPQTRKYGAMKSAVAVSSAGFVGRPASRRVIPRNARIIGRAEGNIIATLMTMSSAKERTRSVDRNREGAMSGIRTSAEGHVAYQAAPTARATAAATGMVRCRSSPAGSAGAGCTNEGTAGGTAISTHGER